MRKTMENLYKGFNAIGIATFVITLIIMACIMVIEMNDMTFRLAWNDTSRFYSTTAIMIGMVRAAVVMFVSGSFFAVIAEIFKRINDRMKES